MKVLFFSQFYEPENIAAAFRVAETAKTWAASGIDVTIFTTYPNYPLGRVFDGYQQRLLGKESKDGITILRSKTVVKPNTSMIKRLQSAFGYFFFGLINVLFQGKAIGRGYDVVLGTSGTVFNALLAWLYAWLHKKPFVLEIRDITYRQMIATGKDAEGFSVRMMHALELFLCNRARHVVVVTRGFQKLLMDEGVSGEKISVFFNGVDAESCKKPRKESERFCLSYFGTLGISQNIFDTLPYAEKIGEHCSAFEYLVIGEGAQRSEFEEILRQKQPPHVHLLHGMPQEDLEPYYEKTDLSIVTLKKSIDFKYTLPSKMFQIMARGVPVLFIGPEGEAAEIVREAGAGIALCGSKKEDLQALDDFFQGGQWKPRLEEMGGNGYKFVCERFSRKKIAEEYLQLLVRVASSVQ